MEHRFVKSVCAALLVALLGFALPQNASADCDMWAWIAPGAENIEPNSPGAIAYKECVKWFRAISTGVQEYPIPNHPLGDLPCEDGWSIFGESIEYDSVIFRQIGEDPPPPPVTLQVYCPYWWSDDPIPGMDPVWPTMLPIPPYPEYRLKFAMAHSRATGAESHFPNPHPFIYGIGGRTLAMQHNGLIYGSLNGIIGPEYLDMSLFTRPYPNNDSEQYGILLMKNVLLGDNYGMLEDLWAIERTVDLIIDGSISYSSLNIYFYNEEDIYAVRKVVTYPSYQLDDHQIWYSFNDNTNRAWGCILTGNNSPDLHPNLYMDPELYMDHWADFTPMGNSTWFKIAANLSSPAGPAPLIEVTPPANVREYAYNGRNPMIGTDASITVGPDSDFVAVWEAGGNIFYNYLDPMGLCERLPLPFITDDTDHEYRNPEVAIDSSSEDTPFYLDCWVVCERGPIGAPLSNEICLIRMDYDLGTKSWTIGDPVVVNQYSGEVAHPAVAWGGGKLVVTWQQRTSNPPRDWHIRAAAYQNGNRCMNDKLVGGISPEALRKYPDAVYVGKVIGSSEPVFVISYLQTGGNQGLYFSQVITTSPDPFIGELVNYPITQNPDNAKPELARANVSSNDVHFVCAFKQATDPITNQIVALRIASPLASPPPPGWQNPEPDGIRTAPSGTPTENIDPRFFDVSLASRIGDAGKVDVAYTNYDVPTSSYQIWCFQVAWDLTSSTGRVDLNACANDFDPGIAIANSPAFQSPPFRRLILWDGNYSSQDRLVANFNPLHFDGDLAGSGQPEPIVRATVQPAGYALNSIHPNPFNPTTTISFALPEASRVTLNVYDVQGRLLANLVNGWREMGHHEVTFDGADLPSGIYLARITAGEWSAAQKLVLMK